MIVTIVTIHLTQLRSLVATMQTERGPVKLNVGGVEYMTSVETLTGGSVFFQSLFSGRLETTRDEEGRIFIDRNGHIFQYVLEFLRTGGVYFDTSDATMVTRVACEAEFFLVTSLMEAMDAVVEQANTPVAPAVDALSHQGYYVLADGDPETDGTEAYFFRDDGTRLLYATGTHAAAFLHLRHVLSIMPDVFRQTPNVATTYADFYTKSIRRGAYTQEGPAVIIRTTQREVNAFAVARGTTELFISDAPQSGLYERFRRFVLQPFPEDILVRNAAIRAAEAAARASSSSSSSQPTQEGAPQDAQDAQDAQDGGGEGVAQ